MNWWLDRVKDGGLVCLYWLIERIPQLSAVFPFKNAICLPPLPGCCYFLDPVWGIEWASVSPRLGLQQTLLVSPCFLGALSDPILGSSQASLEENERPQTQLRDLSRSSPEPFALKWTEAWLAAGPACWPQLTPLLKQWTEQTERTEWMTAFTGELGGFEAANHGWHGVLSPSCSEKYRRSHGGNFLRPWITYTV